MSIYQILHNSLVYLNHMRPYPLQSFLNWYRLKLSNRGYWRSWLDSYLWQWFRPYFPKNYLPVSQIYNLSDIANFRKNLHCLGRFNPIWFQRIFEPETKGVRAWEYGLLLKLLENKNLQAKTILDAGTGGSLLPDFLVSLGAKVISLDTSSPMEPRIKSSSVKHVIGDMTKLKYPDNYFDFVICVSAIEHVGSLKNTKMAFSELLRVKKPTGLLYLTTDVYLKNQTTDNWPGSPANSIKDAYIESDFNKIFGKFLNWPYLKKKLISSPTFSNYRGRFFTTIAIILPPKNPDLNRGFLKRFTKN